MAIYIFLDVANTLIELVRIMFILSVQCRVLISLVFFLKVYSIE